MLSLVGRDGRELAKADLGGLGVVGRAHRFDMPDQFVPREVPFGEAMLLRGYRLGDNSSTGSVKSSADTLPVVLAWQAGEASTRNLAVSVQLIDRSGRLVAQHDSVPQEGRAPVVSWLRGEVVEDSHMVRLPDGLAGEYSLQVVVYDSETGQRLLTSDGRDSAVLQILMLGP
jgi:hypothetical protein